jgi:broad specificity phosphatase PhoE
MKKIILLRHGEVDIENYENISASQFEKWIIEYNNSDIKSDFLTKNEIKELLNKTDILICSNLKRSIQSIEIFDKMPFETNDIFNEAELPFSNWNLLKLNPKAWLIFFRILWFFGYSKNCESYKETKQRVKKATERLLELSKQNETVILTGHGIMNKLIRKELILQKWNETKKVGSKNWDYGVFEFSNFE